jgi:hypothetical protein
MVYGDPRVGLALLAVVVAVMLYDRLQPDPPDETTLDGLTELYSNGKISDAKYNRRREVLLYDEEGIGPFSWLRHDCQHRLPARARPFTVPAPRGGAGGTRSRRVDVGRGAS